MRRKRGSRSHPVDRLRAPGDFQSAHSRSLPRFQSGRAALHRRDVRSVSKKFPVPEFRQHRGAPPVACCWVRQVFLEMDEGVIRAAPTCTWHPKTPGTTGSKNKTYMKLRIGGDLAMTFDKIFVRVRSLLQTRGPYRHRRGQRLRLRAPRALRAVEVVPGISTPPQTQKTS